MSRSSGDAWEHHSLARFLQLWHFLLFASTVEADQLLLGAVIVVVILLITVVVERVLLRRHVFADVLLVIVSRVILVLQGAWRGELLGVSWGGRATIVATQGGWQVLDELHTFTEVFLGGIFHLAGVRDWQEQEDGLNDGPAVVAEGANDDEHEESAEGEE
jgi:hypothetical protein